MSQRLPVDYVPSPIVVALRNPRDLPLALASPHRTIFMLGGSLTSLPKIVDIARSHGRDIFVHADLVQGLGRDAQSVQWLAQIVRPTGILSTRASTVLRAKSLGLPVIQRIFLVDSQAFHTGLSVIREIEPDFVEVMPAVATGAIQELVQQAPCPVIAGGLCNSIAHYRAAIQAGAVAVSTSCRALWQYRGAVEVVKASGEHAAS